MAELVIRQPSVALAQQFEHNLAVVIGINKYAYVRELKTARPDAESLAGVLQDKRRDPLDHYEVIECYDQQASANTLSTLLFETLPARVRQLGKRTRVLFYFAGHGDAEDSGDGLQGFLFPQDAKPGDDTTLLPMSKVQDALAGLDCQHVLIILDCCSAGALPMPQRTRSALRPPPLYWDYFQRYVKRKARQVITSAAHNQLAADEDTRKQLGTHKLGDRDADAGAGHSPFAQALLEALNPEHESSNRPREAGRNGVVTATDLYLYISEVLYRRVGDAQTPGLWTVIGQDPHKSHDQGEFVFLVPGTQIKLEDAPDLTRPGHNPWLGLSAYGPDQADLFAGRDTEIRDLAQMVEAHPLVAVTGPSAAGKTSLLRAGLLPWLADRDTSQASGVGRHWHILPPLSLGKAPLEALGMQVAAHLPAIAATGAADASLPDLNALAARVAAWIEAHPDRRLLLALDVEEALFDTVATEERTKLWALLAQVAQRDILHVVLTLRSDHWRLAEASENATKKPLLPAAVRYELGPMNRDALRQVIEEPAAARMVYLASEKLVDTLVDAVEGQPATLPLLSETLRRMYLRYAEAAREGLRTDRTLTQEDYAAQGDAGGVGGVAADLAKTFYQERLDDAHRRQAMQRVLLRLVDVKQGQYERRQAAHVEFEYPDPETNIRTRAVIAGLTDQGLVVLSADAAGAPVIELGHVALIEAWASLRGWLLDPSKQWGLQRELREQVKRWLPEKQKTELWDDDPKLPQVEDVLWPTKDKQQRLASRLRREWQVLVPKTKVPANTGWLNQAEVDFIRESVKERARFRQRLFGAIAAFVIVLAAATAISLILRDRAVREARRAKAGELAAISEGILGEWPQRSLLLAVGALQTTKPSDGYLPAPEQALRNALRRTGGQVMNAHQKAINVAAISPDDRWLVTGGDDSAAQLWDLDNPARGPVPLTGHEGPISAAAITPDGHWIVTSSINGTVLLWDLQNPLQETIHLKAHNGAIHELAISKDGRWLVTAGADELIYRWDLTQPAAEPVSFSGHYRAVYDLAISDDAEWLASAGWDGKIRKWKLDDPTTPAEVFPGHDAAVRSLAISSDGRWLASGSEHPTALLWDFTNPSTPPRALSTGFSAVNDVAFTTDCTHVAVASDVPGARVQLWDVNNIGAGPRLLSGHSKSVNGLLAVAGNRLLTISDDYLAMLWSVDDLNGEPVVLAGHEAPVRAAAASSNGERLVTADSVGSARLWNPAAAAASPVRLAGHLGQVTALALSHDGQWLATAGLDGDVIVSSPLDPQGASVNLPDHEQPVRAVAFSPNNKWLITAGDDRLARQWALQDLTAPVRFFKDHAEPVTHLAISSDSRWLVTASQDNTVRMWDLEDQQAPSIRLADHGVDPKALAISPDGQWAASGDRQGQILLSRPQNPDADPQAFEDHVQPITAIAFSPSNHWMASAGQDGKVFLTDLTKPSPSQRPVDGPQAAVNDVAFSPDGRWLAAAGSDHIVWLWDLQTKALSSERLEGHTDSVERVFFTPDGNRIMSAGDDGAVRIWRLADREIQPIVLTDHERPVRAIGVDNGSQWLLTGSEDGRVNLWSLNTDYLTQLACRTAGGNLDQEERGRFLSDVNAKDIICAGFPVRPTMYASALFTIAATTPASTAPPTESQAVTVAKVKTQEPNPSTPTATVLPIVVEMAATRTSVPMTPTSTATAEPDTAAKIIQVCAFFRGDCWEYVNRYLLRARQGDAPVNDAADLLGVRIVNADTAEGETYWKAIGVHALLPEEDFGWHSAYPIFLTESGVPVQNVVYFNVGMSDNGDALQEHISHGSNTSARAGAIPLGSHETSITVLGSDLSRPEKSDRVEYLRAVHPRSQAGDRTTTVSGIYSFLVVYQRTQKGLRTQSTVTAPAPTRVPATFTATPNPSPTTTPTPTATFDVRASWPPEFETYIERYFLTAHENGAAINDAADLFGVQIEEADVPEGTLYWKAIGVHRLTAYENFMGRHDTQVLFLNSDGLPVPNRMWMMWGYSENGRPDLTKPSEAENGVARIMLHPGAEFSVAAIGSDLSQPEISDRVDYLRTDHPRDLAINPSSDVTRPQAFLVVFQRTRKVIPINGELAFTEIMYDPPGGGEYEFIEITNLGKGAVDLSSASVVGIGFTFQAGSHIKPDESIVLVRDAAVFGERYPGVVTAGQFTGRLANEGETIELINIQGTTLASVTYDVTGAWPSLQERRGSLTLVDPTNGQNDPSNWRISNQIYGSPGKYPDN